LYEKQYKFLQCVKTENKQTHISDDETENKQTHILMMKQKIKQTHISDDETAVLCAVPLNILTPKLTMKCIKDIAALHQIYIPSKASVKNAQMLLQDHKCNKCDNYISLFEHYKVQSNAQCQQNWYKKLEPDEKGCLLGQERSQFPPAPPSANLCQKIVSDFCADTSPEV